jgi:AcrR family transcriptional regulator
MVMREGGPRAATLKNIAGKAGVTEPAIFRHFDGVDGLFESLFTVVELFYEEFQGYYKADGLVGLDRLEDAYFKIIAALKDNEDFCYLVVHPDGIFRQYPKLRERLAEIKKRDKQSVMDCMKEARAKGQLLAGTDIESAGLSLVGSALLILQAWVAGNAESDPLKDCKKVWNSIRLCIGNPDSVKAVKPAAKATKAKK